MGNALDRRTFLTATAAGFSAAALAGNTAAESPAPAKYQEGISPWPLALNASTIRPAAPMEKIAIAAKTGWDGLELWINDLEQLEEEGHNLKEVAKQMQDQGLYVPNIIGLWECMPETEEAFEASLEKTRERLRRSADIGSLFVAAIPSPDREDFDLAWGAECYRRLIEIGRADYGITVAFEFVGFLKGVHRLGQAAAIALDANDPDACLICDTFHLWRGGSGFNGIRHLDPKFIADFHWNDIPAATVREEGGDADRVYPGDGHLPLHQLLRDLRDMGYSRALSLELFRRDHWESDLQEVAATGLRKMRENIAAALG
jgi:sugar phosphate isomerase/epimerase